MFTPFHRAGLQLHIHTNGDEATEVVLDALEHILDAFARSDHRHTLQHCQMADASQRKTASGRVLGASECIPVADALRAITLGAAYTLKMDHLIGSIEVGKFADFAVLADDPTDIVAGQLKDVEVWGTVLGGRVFQSPEK
jgi:predicted amidohydrolase YtcJ